MCPWSGVLRLSSAVFCLALVQFDRDLGPEYALLVYCAHRKKGLAGIVSAFPMGRAGAGHGMLSCQGLLAQIGQVSL